MRNKTSPCPGAGTGTVRISTVELPGQVCRGHGVLHFISSPFLHPRFARFLLFPPGPIRT